MAWISWEPKLRLVGGARDCVLASGYGPEESAGWHLADDRLTVWSDRLGIVPLYYSHHSGRLICADNLFDIFAQGVPVEPDPLLLACLRILFFCPNDLTIFKGIKRLPPGATLTFDPDGSLAIRTSLTPVKPKSLSRKAAVEAYGELFEQGVRRLTAQSTPLSIPLSGGRDSRHILFACLAAGSEVETFTYRNFPPTDEDESVALALSGRLGCPHRMLDNTDYDYYRSQLRTMHATNFETTSLHGWMWSLMPALGAAAKPFLDGLGGDTLSNGLFFMPDVNRTLRAGRVAEQVERHVKKLTSDARWTFPATRQDIERLVHLLETENTRWLEWPNPQIARTFFTRTRRAIGIAPCTISRLAGVPVLFPYLTAEVFDLLMGLDESFFEKKGFHDEVIITRYPQYADIPFGTKKPAKFGYIESVKLLLPLLRPSMFASVGYDWKLTLSGVLKILAGSDFSKELWRLEGPALSLAVAMLRDRRASEPGGLPSL